MRAPTTCSAQCRASRAEPPQKQSDQPIVAVRVGRSASPTKTAAARSSRHSQSGTSQKTHICQYDRIPSNHRSAIFQRSVKALESWCALRGGSARGAGERSRRTVLPLPRQKDEVGATLGERSCFSLRKSPTLMTGDANIIRYRSNAIRSVTPRRNSKCLEPVYRGSCVGAVGRVERWRRVVTRGACSGTSAVSGLWIVEGSSWVECRIAGFVSRGETLITRCCLPMSMSDISLLSFLDNFGSLPASSCRCFQTAETPLRRRTTASGL